MKAIDKEVALMLVAPEGGTGAGEGEGPITMPSMFIPLGA